MNIDNNTSEKIKALTREIGLPGIRSNFTMLADDSLANNSSYQEYLLQLLEMEYTSRLKNRKASRIRQADFPYKRYIEDLNRNDLPEDAKQKLPTLESLEFIKEGRNVVLAGNPGTGKSHIAIGIGIKACANDYKVLFTTVPRLLTQIKECRSERTLRVLENRFQKYDLVICDEFGYISFDKEGAELLFSHLSLRAGMKSTIITTNLPFNKWDEIFGDKVLTTALVDRLTHKAYIVNMNGKSYRTKETIEWNK
jgi:DNA replication protein DnaC